MVIVATPDIAIGLRTTKARSRYTESAERVARLTKTNEDHHRDVLERHVAWLEFFYVSALLWEFVHQHEIDSLDELRRWVVEVEHHMEASFPDAPRAVAFAVRVLGDADLEVSEEHVHDAFAEFEWSQFVRSVAAIVAECPIELLEQLGRKADEPSLAHRARNVYDALGGFVRRHDPAHAEILRIVGEQYRLGRLSLSDVAKVLGTSTSDAVFELEQDGFARAPTAISMTEEDRASVYRRLRERRLESASAHVVDQDLVERDVIASERIESVDARGWIRRR